MNEILFKQSLQKLTDIDWQSLVDGKVLLIKDDRELFVDVFDFENPLKPMLRPSDFSFRGVSDLKSQILNKSDDILSDYYRRNPLTETGFTHQIGKLVEEFGFEAFCAPQGRVANRTFFVEGGEVVSESLESPKHRYGVFFQAGQQVSAETMKGNFYKWLSSGEAYSEYIGMNVCRYNC